LSKGDGSMTCSAAGKKGGRPTKLTPELQDKICALIEETACSVYTAALSLGVPWRNVYFWEHWGREGRQPYERFTQAVMEARAKSELNHVKEFKQADSLNQRSTQYYPFMLERRFANDYGNRIKVTEQLAEMSDADLQGSLEAVRLRVAVTVGEGAGTPALAEASDIIEAE
jgi:transposase